MTKEPIAILPYDEVDFKFVSDHYDVHINGTCIYDNKICEFEVMYIHISDDEEGHAIKIYSLDFKEKLKWLWTQWLFELCIGHHWTYKNGKSPSGGSFIRGPKWLYHKLHSWYYLRQIK